MIRIMGILPKNAAPGKNRGRQRICTFAQLFFAITCLAQRISDQARQRSSGQP